MDNTVVIKNCNCIKHGQITLFKNQLNIKFGVNGTGKSTIGQAIEGALSGDPQTELMKLLPYGTNPEVDLPQITGLEDFSQVSIFNEAYSSQFIIQDGTLFENSFRVFLKSTECDSISQEISFRLKELVNAFQQQTDFADIHRMLSAASGIIKMTGSRVARTGGLGELIRGNGYGFDKHPDLKPYEAYYGSGDFSRVSKWASWRREGNKQLIGSHTCPFCAGDMDIPKIETQNASIEVVFKSAALKTANELVEFFEGITDKQIADPTAIARIRSNLGDPSKTDEVALDLTKLGLETSYLLEKMNRILSFKPTNISREDIQNLSDTLEAMKIQPEQVAVFYGTARVSTLIADANAQIDNLLSDTGRLKGLFLKYDSKLNTLITRRKDDINNFFRLAGFPYEFCIAPQGNENVITYLKPASGLIEKVDSLANHLSWGELNAFSLVMFMFQAVSDNSDLIILDDPISSFDANKKFAIIQRLFSTREEVSFSGKTVLMLTHDSQPLLDYVRTNLRTHYGIITPINAAFLRTVDAIMTEIPIMPDDLKSIIEITDALAKDVSLPKACRIVNLRKRIECSIANVEQNIPYHILSSLVHNRETASMIDGTPLDEASFENGCQEIISHYSIPDFEYSTWLESVTIGNLLIEYQQSNSYNKVLIARFLLERDKTLAVELRRTKPGLYKFLHESNHIENDYIFQLDPRKYYSIPGDYESELDDFALEHFFK